MKFRRPPPGPPPPRGGAKRRGEHSVRRPPRVQPVAGHLKSFPCGGVTAREAKRKNCLRIQPGLRVLFQHGDPTATRRCPRPLRAVRQKRPVYAFFYFSGPQDSGRGIGMSMRFPFARQRVADRERSGWSSGWSEGFTTGIRMRRNVPGNSPLEGTSNGIDKGIQSVSPDFDQEYDASAGSPQTSTDVTT